jgi:hypothetical protein
MDLFLSFLMVVAAMLLVGAICQFWTGLRRTVRRLRPVREIATNLLPGEDRKPETGELAQNLTPVIIAGFLLWQKSK